MTERLFESHVTTNINEDFREEFLYWPQKKFYPAYFKMITSKVSSGIHEPPVRGLIGPVRDCQKCFDPVRSRLSFFASLGRFRSESDPEFSSFELGPV